MYALTGIPLGTRSPVRTVLAPPPQKATMRKGVQAIFTEGKPPDDLTYSLSRGVKYREVAKVLRKVSEDANGVKMRVTIVQRPKGIT